MSKRASVRMAQAGGYAGESAVATVPVKGMFVLCRASASLPRRCPVAFSFCTPASSFFFFFFFFFSTRTEDSRRLPSARRVFPLLCRSRETTACHGRMLSVEDNRRRGGA